MPAGRQTETHRNAQTDRQTGRQAGRQTDRQTDCQPTCEKKKKIEKQSEKEGRQSPAVDEKGLWLTVHSQLPSLIPSLHDVGSG